MKRLLRNILIACSVLISWSGVATASMFGEENVQLVMLVKQGFEQAAQVRETLEYLEKTTRFARDTAVFAQESVQVGRNIETLLKDPGAFFDHATHTWNEQFPEIQQILENSYGLRQALSDSKNTKDLPLYDPYAYVNAFNKMHSMNDSGFEALAHAVDFWRVNEPHDKAIEVLAVQHEKSLANLKNLASVINTTGLSPVEASIYTAHATSTSAAAQVQAAATLEHISRNLELAIIGHEAQSAADRALLSIQATGAANLRSKSWRLDPANR